MLSGTGQFFSQGIHFDRIDEKKNAKNLYSPGWFLSCTGSSEVCNIVMFLINFLNPLLRSGFVQPFLKDIAARDSPGLSHPDLL